MKIKAVRDVLDYRGRQWTESAEADVDVPNFDPAEIIRKVVETGSFKADVSKMKRPELDRDMVSSLATSFSGGRKFQRNEYCGAVRMVACEFLPIGVQYVIYDSRRGTCCAWVKTDDDLLPKQEAER